MHCPKMQNPGGCIAGASRNQLGGWLHSPSTPLDWRAQILATRFAISPWLAQDMTVLAFGEDGNG